MTTSNPLGLSDQEKGGAFFLFGDDSFRKEETGRALVDWHLDPGTKDFNLDPLRGTEVSVEDLASVLATPPMMAEWRVVILREVEGLAPSPKARTALLKTVEKPPPGLALIMLASVPSGSKAKFYGELKRKARSVEFPEVGPNDVPGWLVAWVSSRHGVEMKEDAARALGGAVGTDLGVLAQEVEKLSSMVDEGEPITVEVVRRSGMSIPTQDRWEWFDLVGTRNFEKAMRTLPVLLGQGESGVYLSMGLATHLLRLGLVRTGGQRALEETLVTMAPRARSWVAQKHHRQAKGWSEAGLQRALIGLRRMDRLLKSSALSEAHVLEEWLLNLMAQEGRERA
jgi:DNA polymerase-3 subunit delta